MTSQPVSPRHALARRIIIDLAAMTVIGVFLALIGPFGSIAAPLPERLVSWIGFAWLGYACYRPMQTIVDWGERTLALPRWGLLAATCLVATVPMTLAVLSLNGLSSGGLRWPGLDAFMATYFSVLVIGGAVTVLFNLVQANPREAPLVAAPVPTAPLPAQALPDVPAGVSIVAEPAPAPLAPPPTNPLLDQLPPELGSSIIALEMEDHYVRVHTALGSALVLMRLRDAMALIGDLEGMQVHRSWWVARGAVEDVLRDGRNIRLKLARDIEAPVARAKIADLKDARWI
ncbi:MAG TPA: LytTR family DNA-binding domain-containing protein [Erythrobacter sp.]|nr:LytTR family DNA-binding domain-containing protein [Erythrobacter sp.]